MADIPRLSKETSIFKPSAIGDGIDGAAQTATDYVTEVSDGIWVTPSDAKPSAQGQATASTSGWHIGDALELLKSGVSMFRVWLEGAVTRMRVGSASSGHIVLGPDAVSMRDGSREVVSISGESGQGYIQSNIASEYAGGNVAGLTFETDTVVGDETDVSELALIGAITQHGRAFVRADAYSTPQDFYWGNDPTPYVSGLSCVAMYGEVLALADGSALYGIGMRRAASNINGGETLFEGTYAATHGASCELDGDLTKVRRLLVEYEDSAGRCGSEWMDVALASTSDTALVGLQTVAANATHGTIIRSKTCELAYSSGAWRIGVAELGSTGTYQYGKVTIGTNGAATWSGVDEIGITKVVGFY